jgi:hypothetical protein
MPQSPSWVDVVLQGDFEGGAEFVDEAVPRLVVAAAGTEEALV